MYAVEFETDITSLFIHLQNYEQFMNQHVKVIVMTDKVPVVPQHTARYDFSDLQGRLAWHGVQSPNREVYVMNGKRYLLDTNAIIALLNGHEELGNLLASADFVAISVISRLEFLSFAGITLANCVT